MTNFITSRAAYLKFMGLAWDPFMAPVAEQELALAVPTADKDILSLANPLQFFVPPTSDKQPILTLLQEPNTTIVLGKPGQGKTTLRLALSAIARRTLPETLIVTYTISDTVSPDSTWEEHAGQLGLQWAIDLFIQTVEHFDPTRITVTKEQIEIFGQIMALGKRPLLRVVQSILDKTEADGDRGLANRWHRINRLPVKYVARLPQLITFLQEAYQTIPKSWSRPNGLGAWKLCQRAADLFDYHYKFIMIDGVDTWHRTQTDMMSLLTPILEQIEDWDGNQTFGKLFLPLELKEKVAGFSDTTNAILPISLEWDQEGLRRLLSARLRAGGSRRIDLNDLADPRWPVDLTALIIQNANGSPRRFITLVSTLIDQHLANLSNRAIASYPQTPQQSLHNQPNLFTELDWQSALKIVEILPKNSQF